MDYVQFERRWRELMTTVEQKDQDWEALALAERQFTNDALRALGRGTLGPVGSVCELLLKLREHEHPRW